MAKKEPVDPVKLLVAILWADEEALEASLIQLREEFGEIDFQGEDYPFEVTGYYQSEMGAQLRRRLITFESLVIPDCLAQAKLKTNEIEDSLESQEAGGRRVNLDVGYLDHHKLVLASLKPAGQKVYLGRGVYADLMFRYHKKKLEPFAWTFPDFRDGRYEEEILQIRRDYLAQLVKN